MTDLNMWIVGIMCSLIAGTLGYFFKSIVQIIKEDKAPLSGVWESTPIDKKITKKDQITLYQSGITMKGEIQRLEPAQQSDRKWNFEGRLIGSNFCAVFWPTNRVGISYGCWYLHHTNDWVFEGFYLKLSDGNAMPIQTVPIIVKKVRGIQKRNLVSAFKFWK